jgi:hypothetical protein
MSPDVAGLCVDHEDGFEALAKGVQLRPVTHPGKKIILLHCSQTKFQLFYITWLTGTTCARQETVTYMTTVRMRHFFNFTERLTAYEDCCTILVKI